MNLEEIKARINPQYADTIGTESHERKWLCDLIELLRQQLADCKKREVMLRDLIPKRIPDGFVSFGKYYSEQEDKFNDPYNPMCKFKRKYLSDCEEALAATEPKEQGK